MASALLQSSLQSINDNLFIDLTESQFLSSVFYALLNFSMWMLIPHLEFKYNALSRLFGNNKSIANDFFAFFLVQTGTFRNLAFNAAMTNNLKVGYGGFDFLFEVLGVGLIVFGFILVFFSFYRLGMKGMYFGDHFGFLFTEKITAFPYNRFDNPQYVGTTAFFFGFAMYHHSPVGILLTVVTNCLYAVLNVVEAKKLKVFYPDTCGSSGDKKKIK